ncbi:MAG TPA: Asp-tRNA(Asn)/Glu-tRNA(Gln) amidotransferase subunit GatA, partial [Candidatus Moranbacteria bacterium]|nr:Asp-tRNA(Asn)/Glu-tRNA(Gln) amidotransferase subunit GatA [Candidatus Moranbacteria bacterium]
ETSYFGRVENPLCKGRVPGGSSSGSAVCVTTNEAPFALGSDTGGSVRQPASFCGVVGYKPSYGLVSRYGLVSFASSFDQIGIISKNVPDCALIAKSICRRDKKDLTSVKKDISFDNIDGFSVKGKKIAVISELVSGYAKEKVLHAASFFASKGASIEYINMPYYDYLLECYYILSTAEISSNLARFDGIRYGYASGFSSEKQIQETRTEGFCNEVKRRIVLGTFVLSAGSYYGYYQKALNLRNSLIYEYNKIFSDYDFVLTPVSTVEPWPFGAKQDVEMYKNDMCTVAANLIGAPAVSVPAGFTKTGFPAGVQLMAAKFCDGELLAAAAFLEKGLKGDPHA